MIFSVDKPLLSIGSLGGTVSMSDASHGKGVTPRLDCEAMLASVPQLNALARLRASTLCLLPSASLGFEQLLEVLCWAMTEVERGAHGVILSQGTDTLEEVAYMLDLLWPFDTPLVLTGAMRAASHPGSDGPANMLAASQVALDESSRGRGVLVVMNDEIHTAAKVRKTASVAIAAFESPGYGPAGVLMEGTPDYHQAVDPRTVLPIPERTGHQVAILEATLGADTRLLEALPGLGYEGLVVAGFGAGHVSQAWADALQVLARDMPVVVATRTGSGATATATYGFAGGEIDLQAKGVHMAGALCPRKCRVLLWLLVGSKMNGAVGGYFPR